MSFSLPLSPSPPLPPLDSTTLSSRLLTEDAPSLIPLLSSWLSSLLVKPFLLSSSFCPLLPLLLARLFVPSSCPSLKGPPLVLSSFDLVSPSGPLLPLVFHPSLLNRSPFALSLHILPSFSRHLLQWAHSLSHTPSPSLVSSSLIAAFSPLSARFARDLDVDPPTLQCSAEEDFFLHFSLFAHLNSADTGAVRSQYEALVSAFVTFLESKQQSELLFVLALEIWIAPSLDWPHVLIEEAQRERLILPALDFQNPSLFTLTALKVLTGSIAGPRWSQHGVDTHLCRFLSCCLCQWNGMFDEAFVSLLNVWFDFMQHARAYNNEPLAWALHTKLVLLLLQSLGSGHTELPREGAYLRSLALNKIGECLNRVLNFAESSKGLDAIVEEAVLAASQQRRPPLPKTISFRDTAISADDAIKNKRLKDLRDFFVRSDLHSVEKCWSEFHQQRQEICLDMLRAICPRSRAGVEDMQWKELLKCSRLFVGPTFDQEFNVQTGMSSRAASLAQAQPAPIILFEPERQHGILTELGKKQLIQGTALCDKFAHVPFQGDQLEAPCTSRESATVLYLLQKARESASEFGYTIEARYWAKLRWLARLDVLMPITGFVIVLFARSLLRTLLS